MARLALSDFSQLGDWEKLITVEWKLSRSLEAETWVATGGGAYYIDLPGEPEIVSVEEDGVALDEKFGSAACDAAAPSWYYNDITNRLYVQTTDSDDPATLSGDDPKYSICAFFWAGICNSAIIDLEREDQVLENGTFDRTGSSTDFIGWTESAAGTSTVTRDSDNAYDADSAYALKITIDAGGDTARAFRSITLRPSRKARFRIKYKMAGAGDAAQIRIYDTGSNVWLDSSGDWQTGATNIDLVNSTTYTEHELEFTAHKSYSAYYFEVRSSDANAVIYFDNAEVWRIRQPMWWRPLLASNSVPVVTQSIGNFYMPDESIAFGSLRFLYDSGILSNKDVYNWDNGDIVVKVGNRSSSYDELAYVFTGYGRQPTWGSTDFTVDTKDFRALLGKIPKDRFDATNYPNCETDWVNRPIPVLWGLYRYNITPPQSDTTAKTFKVSKTVWGSNTYALDDITAVYRNGGAALTLGVDYTVDLANGEFTLAVFNAGDVITCDANGILFDFEDSAPALAFSAADFIVWLYTVEHEYDPDKLCYGRLKDLKDTRTFAYITKWIDDEIETSEIQSYLKKSCVFHLYFRLDGTLMARRIKDDDSVATFRDIDLKNFSLTKDTENVYKTVVVKFDQDPTTGVWEIRTSSTDKTEWVRNDDRQLIIETWLQHGTAGITLAEDSAVQTSEPDTVLRCTLPHPALMLEPADKITIEKTITLDDTAYTLIDNEEFVVTEISKNVNTGEVDIVAIKDRGGYSWFLA